MEIVSEKEINGFDPDGEPVIQTLADGSLQIVFEAMPPFFSEDAGTEHEFEKFENQMAQSLGVEVTREDRELFVISSPASDTLEKAIRWLENFPKPPA